MISKLFDDGDELVVGNVRRDIPEAESCWADEHVEVLQHCPLVFFKLGWFFQVSFRHTLWKDINYTNIFPLKVFSLRAKNVND